MNKGIQHTRLYSAKCAILMFSIKVNGSLPPLPVLGYQKHWSWIASNELVHFQAARASVEEVYEHFSLIKRRSRAIRGRLFFSCLLALISTVFLYPHQDLSDVAFGKLQRLISRALFRGPAFISLIKSDACPFPDVSPPTRIRVIFWLRELSHQTDEPTIEKRSNDTNADKLM